jgi:DNA-binding CsgD family transcriptional regulator
MTLSTTDLSRFEHASRLLTSPLAAPSPEAWLREAGGAVRDLVGGRSVVLQYPTTDTFPYFSEDAEGVASGVEVYVREVGAEGVRFSDPVVDTWNRLRRQSGIEAFCWDENRRLVEDRGFRPEDSPIVMDVVQGEGFGDFAGMMGATPEGDAMIWVLHPEYGALSHTDRTVPLLRALVPAFHAGLDTLARLGAHRAALDAVSEPLAVFGPEGRELHRNSALRGLLDEDPEGSAVDLALRRLGRSASRGEGTPAEARHATAHGRYTLRPTRLPPGAFGEDPSVLVTVRCEATPALPAPEAVRARHGLTGRQAEVALLVAEGHSNADIAERLYVSAHTVRHHVEAVLTQLAVASRAGVAARLMGAA